MQRRQFLSGLAATVTALTATNRCLALPPDDPILQNLGLQLYTVRNQLGEDWEATIQAVADAGYQQVELMEVIGSDDLVERARDLGMSVKSGFFDWRTIVTPEKDGVPSLEQVVDAALKLKLDYLVFGYIGKEHRRTADDYRRLAAAVNTAGERIGDAGLQLCYHNHSFEFRPLEDRVKGFHIFAERFDPQLVRFELDVFWVALGGWNPLEIMERLDGRIAQLHLKDLKPGTPTLYDESDVPATAFQEVGDGLIDFREIITEARRQGIEQFHVEQDESPIPLESIAISREYLAQLKL